MTTIIPVPGAWLDARAWDAVAAPLREAGHSVLALTLSGLGRHDSVADRANAAEIRPAAD